MKFANLDRGKDCTQDGTGFSHGTWILMHNRVVEEIQNIHCMNGVIGENRDSPLVTVIVRGTGHMYLIQQSKGMNYTVASEHLLVLEGPDENVIDISVKDFMDLPDCENYKGIIIDLSTGARSFTSIDISYVGDECCYGIKTEHSKRFLLADGTLVACSC